MKALVKRSTVQVRDLDKSQELGVLYEIVEVEQETGQIGLISVSV